MSEGLIMLIHSLILQQPAFSHKRGGVGRMSPITKLQATKWFILNKSSYLEQQREHNRKDTVWLCKLFK